MNESEADQLLDVIAETQKLSVLDRAAWAKVLGPLSLEEATARLVDAKTRKAYVNPVDVNPPVGAVQWQEAWLVVVAQWPTLGAGGDYGDPAINTAVMAVRNDLRHSTQEKAKWAFRDAFLAVAASEARSSAALDAGGIPQIGGGTR